MPMRNQKKLTLIRKKEVTKQLLKGNSDKKKEYDVEFIEIINNFKADFICVI
jgi:hypothetical protein